MSHASFPSPTRQIEGITEYKLANGLKVLLFPDASQQKVTVNITYLVGSRHEGRGEAGMAHLLEHMLFKGTPAHPNVKGALQDKGAFFNATTWLDRTNYFETVSASKDNLEFALRLEADRMINSWIRQEDLDAEMTVVRNEFEMGENNPIHVLHDQMMAVAYQWHNYGKTTIGNRSDIERVPVKNLKAFYSHYYQPDNAVLIVAGNFEEAFTQERILHYFGSIPRPERSLDDTYTEEPTQDGVRAVRLYRVGDVAQSAVAYHVPAASHADYTALRVLVDVLADEPSGILYQELVEKGHASELFAMAYALKEPGLFMSFVRPNHNDEADALLERLIACIEKLDESIITADKVERAKIRILKSIKLSMANSKDIALKLSESIAQGDWRLFFYGRDLVKSISLDDVLRVARYYFVESNRTTGIFIPTAKPARAQIPQTPHVETLLEGYTGAQAPKDGEEFEASIENIEKRTSREVLAGTIKVAALAKATRAEANHAYFVFRFGNEESLLKHRHGLRFIPHLLQRGSQKYSYQEIQDTLDALESSMHFYATSPGILVAEITSDKHKLAKVISLMAELLQNPRFSEEEFTIVQKRELADLEETRTDPMRIGMNAVERLKHPFEKDSLHYVRNTDEKIADLKALRLDDVKDAYHAIYGANHLEVALVGDFEPETKSLIEECFAGFRSPVPYARVISPYKEAISDTLVLKTPDKQMAIVAMGLNFPMRDDNPDYATLRLANYIFGESMKSRLMQRLREKEGISYGAGSSLEVSKYDEVAGLSLYAMCATHKADDAMKAMQEEWNRFIQEGPTHSELEEAKEGFRLYFNNLLANDPFVMSSLASMLNIGRTFAFYTDLLETMQKLDVHAMQTALQKHWANHAVATVKAGDF